jgi:hypothetical protein
MECGWAPAGGRGGGREPLSSVVDKEGGGSGLTAVGAAVGATVGKRVGAYEKPRRVVSTREEQPHRLEESTPLTTFLPAMAVLLGLPMVPEEGRGNEWVSPSHIVTITQPSRHDHRGGATAR